MDGATTIGAVDSQDQGNGPARVPGDVAPYEVGTPKGKAERAETPKQDYGPNNENLPRRLQLALQVLFTTFLNEGQKARRDEIKKAKLAREFWKGLQYKYWSETDATWHLPWEIKNEEPTDGSEPRFAFVTNYFQAFGLSIIAVLSQDIPAVRCWPQNAQQPEDVATAAAATDVIELVERNNHAQELMVDEAFYLWCDGKIGGYVRYVVDGQRFGWHDENEMDTEQRKLGPDVYSCPDCGQDTMQGEFLGVCSYCGNELGSEAFRPAPVTDVPVVRQVIQMPNGQEVIDIVGAIELITPPWANQQWQFPYLLRDKLAHLAMLKAQFPNARKKLGGASIAPEDAGAQYERTIQMSLVSGGEMEPVGAGADLTNSLRTYRDGWLRPWAFELIDEDDVREELYTLFPTGCYCAFGGDVYLCSRNESMDDHWVVEHAFPGDGQNRPAIGTSFISVQQRYNTLSNLVQETAEQGVPATFANPAVVDFDMIRDSYIEPGAIYPMTAPAGIDARTQFFQTQATQVSPQVTEHMNELAGPIGQFLTGAFPALFGGEMEGNDTASGYSMARDQALGRIGLVWRRMKWFHAKLMMLAVGVFRDNRPDDVNYTVFGKNGFAKSKWIRRANLKGGFFTYPETDSQYPEVPALKKSVLLQMMQNPDPKIQALLSHGDNLDAIRRIVGLEDLVNPEADSAAKQHEEIDQLLEDGQSGAGPIEGPPQPNLVAGVMEPGEPEPSVPVDELLDNHDVEFEVCQAWANSEAGRRARIENPNGFMNVRAHAQQHLEATQRLAMQMSQSMMPQVQGPGAGAPGPQQGGK